MPKMTMTWDDLYRFEQNHLYDLAETAIDAQHDSFSRAAKVERYQQSAGSPLLDAMALVYLGYPTLKHKYKSNQLKTYLDKICIEKGFEAVDLTSFPTMVQAAYLRYWPE